MWAAAAGMWRERPARPASGLKGFPAHRDGHASLALSSGSDTAGAGQAFRAQPLLSPHNMYLLVLSEQGLIGLHGARGQLGWRSWPAGLRSARGRPPRAGDGAGPPTAGSSPSGCWSGSRVDFLYADIGGPSTVLTAVVLGLVAWWALAPTPTAERRGTRPMTETHASRTTHGAPPSTGRSRRPDVRPGSGRFLARAALVTAALTVAGALLGLVRDQAIARSSAPAPTPTPSWSPGPCRRWPRRCSSRTAWRCVLVPAFSLALAPGGRAGDAGPATRSGPGLGRGDVHAAAAGAGCSPRSPPC